MHVQFSPKEILHIIVLYDFKVVYIFCLSFLISFLPVLNQSFMYFIFLFVGDTESLWKIEKLRSETMKQHTLATGLSCAKVANLSTPLSDLIINFVIMQLTSLCAMCLLCGLLHEI